MDTDAMTTAARLHLAGLHARSIVRDGLADVRDQTGEETAEQAAYQPRHAAPDRHIIPLLWDARKANA